MLLAPVAVNILAFHFFIAPEDSLMAVVLAALQLALAWVHRDAYRPLLQPRAIPPMRAQTPQ